MYPAWTCQRHTIIHPLPLPLPLPYTSALALPRALPARSNFALSPLLDSFARSAMHEILGEDKVMLDKLRADQIKQEVGRTACAACTAHASAAHLASLSPPAACAAKCFAYSSPHLWADRPALSLN